MGAEPAARFRGLGLCGLDAARPAGRDDEAPSFGAAAGRRRHAVLRQTADAGRKRRLASSLLVFLQRRGVRGPRRDRKSTRLNSSHVSISYAVFCLKKKKRTKLLVHTKNVLCDH